MMCPDCQGNDPTCVTCGNEATVPDWLADPDINGPAAADTWR